MSNLPERQSKLDKHRNTIYRLYITENKTLSQVIDIMKRDHNLLASYVTFPFHVRLIVNM